MASSAARPPKLAPYPMLVGTATTGQAASPPTTLASAPSMPATTTMTSAALQQRQVVQQAVYARHPDVEQALDARPEQLRCYRGLLGYGHVGRARAHDQDVALVFGRWRLLAEGDDARHLVITGLRQRPRTAWYVRRIGAGGDDERILEAQPLHDLRYLFRCLPLREHHLRARPGAARDGGPGGRSPGPRRAGSASRPEPCRCSCVRPARTAGWSEASECPCEQYYPFVRSTICLCIALSFSATYKTSFMLPDRNPARSSVT